MEARICTVLIIIACVHSILGFFIPAPRGIGSVVESSYEPMELMANNPGLFILNGPVEPSASQSVEEVVSEPVEADIEYLESNDDQAGGGPRWDQGQTGQARPDGPGSPVVAAGGAGAGNEAGVNVQAVPGQGVRVGAAPGAAAGSPQQISSSHTGRAAGVGVAVGACFLVVLAVGVAAYVIIQRRNRNAPERLQ